LAPLAHGIPWWVSIDTECGNTDADVYGDPVGEQLNAQSINDRLATMRHQLPATYTGLYDAVNVGRYVSQRGHEAPLFVLGYPKVFPEVVGIGCGEFAPREVTFANRVVDALNETLAKSVGEAAAAGGRRIYFVDAVEHAMQPSNTLCDADRSGIVGVGLLEGATKKVFDSERAQELVHPNTSGYARIAGAIASWSSSPAAPATATGTTARPAPYVATGRTTCQPLALTMRHQDIGTGQGACLIVQVNVSEPSTYWAELHSTPTALGGGEMNAGEGKIRLDLPATLPPGRHTLHLAMVGETGVITTYSVDLMVAAPLKWWWWLIVAGSALSLAIAVGLTARAIWPSARRKYAMPITPPSNPGVAPAAAAG